MAKKKNIIIAAICVILVVAVVVVIAVVAKNKGETPTETTTVEETQKPISMADAIKDLDPNKYVAQLIGGKPYIVVLGEDGKHVTNDKNQILVVLTDENGNVVFDDNGDPKTTWIDVNTTLVDRTGISTKDFTLSIPDGWKPHGGGYFVKEGSTGNMIRCDIINQEGYAEMSLDEFLTVYGERQAKEHENFKKQGRTVKFEKKNITLNNNISAVYHKEEIRYVATDKNGNSKDVLIDYNEVIYFEMNGTKYRISLTVPDNDAQKAIGNFDFVNCVNQNLTLS